MNRQKSHRCSSSDGSLFYIVLNYSSTAACAAASYAAEIGEDRGHGEGRGMGV